MGCSSWCFGYCAVAAVYVVGICDHGPTGCRAILLNSFSRCSGCTGGFFENVRFRGLKKPRTLRPIVWRFWAFFGRFLAFFGVFWRFLAFFVFSSQV